MCLPRPLHRPGQRNRIGRRESAQLAGRFAAESSSCDLVEVKGAVAEFVEEDAADLGAWIRTSNAVSAAWSGN